MINIFESFYNLIRNDFLNWNTTGNTMKIWFPSFDNGGWVETTISQSALLDSISYILTIIIMITFLFAVLGIIKWLFNIFAGLFEGK